MFKQFALFAFAVFYLLSYAGLSWESHYLLTYQALRGMPGLSGEHDIPAETLESFVTSEQKGLRAVLEQTERLAARTLPHYPSLPQSLAFKPDPHKDLTKQFLMSLRVNPAIAYPLFVLKEPRLRQESDVSFGAHELKTAPLSTLAALEQGKALKKVVPGQKLSAAEILASASEEPDHGMDFDLWQNNSSWYGALYNFGEQPFGNPLLSFGTQAPFHMGFYHEPALLYWAGNFLRRCYPEYRIMQFMALSRFAFATKHPYWGYRFLGMADHYLQDLTQFYHARVAPDMSVPKLIGINLLAMAGVLGPKQRTTQLLTNKHLGLENYQYGAIKAALASPHTNARILQALSDQGSEAGYGSYSESYARQVIAREAYDKAASIDALVSTALPSRLLDPTFIFDGYAPGVDLYREVQQNPTPASAQLEEAFLSLMRSFGVHTRQSIRWVLPHL